MATENLVPQYLAAIFSRAVPDPVDDNSPFQGFQAPVDDVIVSDSVAASIPAVATTYGQAKYGIAHYQ